MNNLKGQRLQTPDNHREITLIHSGEEFFVCALHLIEKSRKKIYLQTYILGNDPTGKMITGALERAVKRGIKVTHLVDAFGSYELDDEFIEGLKRKGIEFRQFSPIVFSVLHLRLGRRLHHKIILADENEALVGGINIADKYRVSGHLTPWLDYAFYVKGAICKRIEQVVETTWDGTTGQGILEKKIQETTKLL